MAGMNISKLTSAEILTALQNGEITPEEVQDFSKSEQTALTQGLAGDKAGEIGDQLNIETKKLDSAPNTIKPPTKIVLPAKAVPPVEFVEPPAKTIKVDYYSINDEYDKKGNQTRKLISISSDKVEYFHDFEYDEKGNRIRLISRNINGSLRDFLDYEYDENGRLTREVARRYDGTAYNCCDYEYDENGKVTRRIQRRESDGTAFNCYDYQYDKNGNQIMKAFYDAKGNLGEYTTKEFDDKGNLTHLHKHDKYSKVVDEITDYEYDEKGNITLEKITKDSSVVVYEHIYDKKGNLDRKIIHVGNQNGYVTGVIIKNKQ